MMAVERLGTLNKEVLSSSESFSDIDGLKLENVLDANDADEQLL